MTIEVPTPSAELIQQLETATIETNQTEAAAIAAIRVRFTEYAKHNGNIQTASYHKSQEAYLMDGGRRLRAIRVFDNFGEEDGDQGSSMSGYRLYLSERGEWVEVMRAVCVFEGEEASYWVCDGETGHVRKMTDDDVASEYELAALLAELGKSMTEMTKKLPARHAKLRQRAELASRVIAAVSESRK